MDSATAPPRALWELATYAGTEQATTTFHTSFNKHRPAERPYALGFLTRGRFLRFAQTEQGHALLQVDCSRPGAGGAAREGHIRSVCSDFFNLCVEKSKTNEVQEGDYADVGSARNMRSDTYSTFPGWITAISSPAFQRMRLEWQKASVDIPQLPPRVSPPPSSSTNVVVGVPVEVAVEAPPPPPPPPPPPSTTGSAKGHVSKPFSGGVVDIDTSDTSADEAPMPKAIRPRVTPPPPPPPPAPPSPAPAAKKRKRGSNPNETSGTDLWHIGCLGFELIRAYDELKSRGARGELAFDANHEHRGASYEGMYTILVTQRQVGKSARLTDGYVILSGVAADRARIVVTRSKPKLRSVPDIVRHFNINTDLNTSFSP